MICVTVQGGFKTSLIIVLVLYALKVVQRDELISQDFGRLMTVVSALLVLMVEFVNVLIFDFGQLDEWNVKPNDDE